jgi:hypothetical protein
LKRNIRREKEPHIAKKYVTGVIKKARHSTATKHPVIAPPFGRIASAMASHPFPWVRLM